MPPPASAAAPPRSSTPPARTVLGSHPTAPTSYISYHDSGNSTLIHVQRSDDDGLTWRRAGDPIVGQGRVTGNATFNNDQGPLKADLTNHFVYDIYAEGEAGIQKATSATFNNIIVSRSADMGKTWTPSLVYHAPLFTGLNNVFPSLAVDQANGKVYNLGGTEVVGLKALAELMVQLVRGGTFELVSFPRERKAIDIGDYYSDFSLIKKELGWQPTVDLREGLKRTVEYYQDHHRNYWDEDL